MHVWHVIQHWLAYHTGSLNEPGVPPNYNFWSGFGSDLGEVAIVGGVWKLVNCHEKSCWRVGHHYQGYVVCHRHKSKVPGCGK